MLQQIAENVAQEAVRAARVEGFVEPSAHGVDTHLWSTLESGCGSHAVREGTDQAFAVPVGHADHVDVFNQIFEGGFLESRIVVRLDRNERIEALYPSFCSVDSLRSERLSDLRAKT